MSFNDLIRILFLVTISGFLAYIGDMLGFKLGKKRISLFGMRPRNSARFIAVVIGIFIMLFTLGFASFVSQEVRIALFNIDNLLEQQKNLMIKNKTLKREISELKKRGEALKISNQKLQSDINSKIKKIQSLEEELKNKQEGRLAFEADEVIGYRLLRAGLSDSAVINEFKKLIKQIIAISKAKGAKPRKFDIIWKESAVQRKRLIEFYKNIVKNAEDSIVVIVKCKQNVFIGEGLGKISFMVEKNRLILKKGTLFSLKNLL